MNYTFVKQPPVNTAQLTDEITTAGLPAPTEIDIDDVNLTIIFNPDITPDQQVTLGTVVANHVANPNYVTLATMADVANLTNYLNNADPNVVATARAVMIKMFAPRLPDGLIRTINAQIFQATGK